MDGTGYRGILQEFEYHEAVACPMRSGLVADADDDLAEGSAFEVVVSGARVVESVDGVDDGVEFYFFEFLKHAFEGSEGADGDAANDGLFLNDAEEWDGGVEAFDDADDGDLTLGADGFDGPGEVRAANYFEDVIDALLVGKGEDLVLPLGVGFVVDGMVGAE